jgi:CBS-domain-containing membrane protein
VLTPVAAIGLVLVMVGATVLHMRRHESFLAPVALGMIGLVSAALGFLSN